MSRFLAFVTVLLAGCVSAEPQAEVVTLRGEPGEATCRLPAPYSGVFAVLRLDSPVSFGSLEGVTEVELIMHEPEFVQYGSYIGRPSTVSCRLGESGLCGYPQLACGVTAMLVEP